jgi:replicative DNA helicase
MSAALPVIPHNAGVERSLLGVLLLAPERVGEVAERLDAEDFFTSVYRKVYDAILQLDSAGKAIELFTLHEVLANDQEISDAGGTGLITSLSDGMYSKAPLAEYCQILKNASALRRVQRLCDTTTAQIAEGKRSAEVLDSVAAEFESIRDDSRSLERGPVHISAVTKEIAPVLEQVANGAVRMVGTPTGYSDIDRLTAGWQAGDYNILAARPSVGKTALALEFTLRQLKAGNPVAFFSLEMSRDAIYLRMVCREAGVDSQRLRNGMLSSGDLKKILAAVAVIDALPLWIDDSAALRASDLRWRLRSLAKRHGIKFAIADYLQLLRAPGKDRFERVTNVSIELKAAAKELGQLTGGTLLALSQLNRAGVGERPRLENLRESGQLEQDGDVIFLLYDVEQTTNGQVQPCTKILEIAKQRNGPCADVRFTFLPAIGGFEQSVSDDVWGHDSKLAAANDSEWEATA